MSLPHNALRRSDPISQLRQQGFWDDFVSRNPFSQDPRPAPGPSRPRRPLQTNLFGSDQYVQDPVQPIQRKNQGRRQQFTNLAITLPLQFNLKPNSLITLPHQQIMQPTYRTHLSPLSTIINHQEITGSSFKLLIVTLVTITQMMILITILLVIIDQLGFLHQEEGLGTPLL